jgi:phenylacetate-CoA ligase
MIEFFDFPSEKLKNLLEYVINSKFSNFYKNKYSNLNVDNIDTRNLFLGLPFLVKDEILNTNYKDRLYCSPYDVKALYTTSGTSNNQKICVIPRSGKSPDFMNKLNEKFEKLGIGFDSPMLILLPLGHGLLREFMYSDNIKVPIVFADVNKLSLLGPLIIETKPATIVTMPTIFESALLQNKEELSSLKWMLMAGETCTPARRDYLQQSIPNTYIDFAYGLAESIGPLVYRCINQKEQNPNIFHPLQDVIFEIIDEKGNILPLGNVGELVVTTLEKHAFPLIRYRTGDAARLNYSTCGCENKLQVEIFGRIDLDFIRVSGITLHEQALSLALAEFSNEFDIDHMLEVDEINENGVPVYELKLFLIPKKTNKLSEEEAAKKISALLRVSIKSYLSDVIKEGVIRPLKVVFVEKIERQPGKKMSLRRMF